MLQRKHKIYNTRATKGMHMKCERICTGTGIISAKDDASAWDLGGKNNP
jgi:hypothetical protein